MLKPNCCAQRIPNCCTQKQKLGFTLKNGVFSFLKNQSLYDFPFFLGPIVAWKKPWSFLDSKEGPQFSQRRVVAFGCYFGYFCYFRIIGLLVFFFFVVILVALVVLLLFLVLSLLLCYFCYFWLFLRYFGVFCSRLSVMVGHHQKRNTFFLWSANKKIESKVGKDSVKNLTVCDVFFGTGGKRVLRKTSASFFFFLSLECVWTNEKNKGKADNNHACRHKKTDFF